MPLLSQDARGSFSGIQFSRNRSGNFGSRKSTSNHKQGDVATNHRARLKAAHTAWEALDPGLKSCWDTYAAPTQTGRNAFIGATLTNLVIDLSAPTGNPLEAPAQAPITNLVYNPGVAPLWIYLIAWDWRDDPDGRIICYLRTPRGFAIPHVRQFRYWDAGPPNVPFLNLPNLQHLPHIALRVVYWDPTLGKTIREWRANIPTDTFYEFEPPPL